MLLSGCTTWMWYIFFPNETEKEEDKKNSFGANTCTHNLENVVSMCAFLPLTGFIASDWNSIAQPYTIHTNVVYQYAFCRPKRAAPAYRRYAKPFIKVGFESKNEEEILNNENFNESPIMCAPHCKHNFFLFLSRRIYFSRSFFQECIFVRAVFSALFG